MQKQTAMSSRSADQQSVLCRIHSFSTATAKSRVSLLQSYDQDSNTNEIKRTDFYTLKKKIKSEKIRKQL